MKELREPSHGNGNQSVLGSNQHVKIDWEICWGSYPRDAVATLLSTSWIVSGSSFTVGLYQTVGDCLWTLVGFPPRTVVFFLFVFRSLVKGISAYATFLFVKWWIEDPSIDEEVC